MNDLMRDLAPITPAGWAEIEDQARSTLTTYLSARKLVDVEGPKGWGGSDVNMGRAEALSGSPVDGVEARRRVVRPLVELRAPFALSRAELDDVNRGAPDPDLEPLVDAARKLARAEDRMVYYGFDESGVVGICPGCDYPSVSGSGGFTDYPRLLSEATNALRQAGVGGPYGLALGPDAYTGLAETAGPGGYPVIEHVDQIIDGPIVWAPALQGGVVMSLRGGDFELTLGRDISIGYLRHDEETVHLYLEESVTFRNLAPEAAITLESPE